MGKFSVSVLYFVGCSVEYHLFVLYREVLQEHDILSSRIMWPFFSLSVVGRCNVIARNMNHKLCAGNKLEKLLGQQFCVCWFGTLNNQPLQLCFVKESGSLRVEQPKTCWKENTTI